mgnify:CR=1 FL=1
MDFLKLYSTLFQENKIEYQDDIHVYVLGDKKIPSVTKIKSKFKEPFDGEYFSLFKALQQSGYKVKKGTIRSFPRNPSRNTKSILIDGKEYNANYDELKDKFSFTITPEELRLQWSNKGKASAERGTMIHKYLENAIRNKFDNSIRYSFLDDYLASSKDVNLFNELIVHNNIIAGTIDRLDYSPELDGLVIKDYKTDEEITTSNYFQKLLRPFSHLDDCKLNEYSIQINLYRQLFESMTGEEIKGMELHHIDLVNEKVTVYNINKFEVPCEL